MKNWNDKFEVKKGAIGERIANELLSKKGYILYRPVNDGPHKIDFFAHKKDAHKKIICVEAKAKRRMKYYYETGFNYNAYVHYTEIKEKHDIETFIFFIDDFEKCVYGNWLRNLGKGKKRGDGKNHVIVWNLSKMIFIRKLTSDEMKELSQYTNENHSYKGVQPYFDNTQQKLF